jgi:cytochrome c oxidase subunit II
VKRLRIADFRAEVGTLFLRARANVQCCAARVAQPRQVALPAPRISLSPSSSEVRKGVQESGFRDQRDNRHYNKTRQHQVAASPSAIRHPQSVIKGFALQLPFMPVQASTHAGEVDALYLALVGLTAFFFLLIAGLETYFAVKYRRRSPHEYPRQILGSIGLELVWTFIPLLIAMGFFVWGAKVYFQLYTPPREALEIYGIGKQWMWKFQHPEGVREINELHVPVGRRVKVILTSEDVIHSFYVPAFRIKTDVLPGARRYTMAWFEATKPGRYHLFCTEYCGTDHSGMIGWVEVMEPQAYQTWLSGGSGATPAVAGGNLFQSLGCVTCHQPNGQGRGPSLVGVFGRPETLNNGQKVTADENYLRESILQPQAKIVAGYEAIMPTFQGLVSEEQLLQLIAYIKSQGIQQSTGGTAVGATTGTTGGTTSGAGGPPGSGDNAPRGPINDTTNPSAQRSNPLAPNQPKPRSR